VFTIELPPLRDRLEDLPILAQHYLRRFGSELGREVREIAPDTLAILKAYPWPGNIRELQSVLKQALLHASGTTLLPAFLPDLRSRNNVPAVEGERLDLEAFIRDHLASDEPELYARAHDEVDRLLFSIALAHTKGNQREAAQILGISRQTMRVKLRALGMQVTHGVDDGAGGLLVTALRPQ